MGEGAEEETEPPGDWDRILKAARRHLKYLLKGIAESLYFSRIPGVRKWALGWRCIR